MARWTTNLIVGLTAMAISGSTVLAGGSCQGRSTRTCRSTAYEWTAPEPDEEEFVDEESDLEVKAVECEVQVQHPLTFEWITVQSFGDEEQAQAYQERIEQRYWVLHRSNGSRQTSFQEAYSRSDANSRTASLRRAGNAILDVKPVVAQVVELSLLPLLDSAPLLDDEPEQFDADLAGGAASEESGSFQETAPAAPNDLEALLGLWEAATRDADGNAQRLLLNLNADGSAELTVPTAGGGETRIERSFQIEDGAFKLVDGASELVLGNLIEADADRVVLERPEGRITLTRP